MDAALELIVEHHDQHAGVDRRLRDVFPFLSLGRIAERAEVSRATLYHHWGGPEPTGSSVLDRLLSDVAGELWARSADPDAVGSAELELRGTGTDGAVTLDDVVLFTSEQEAGRVAGTSQALIRSSQVLTLHGVVDTATAEQVLDVLAAVYTDVAASFDMRVAAPLTMDDVAFLVSVAFEGFVVGAASERPALSHTYPRPAPRPASRPAEGSAPAHEDLPADPTGPDRVSLVSLVVHAIVCAALEPIPSDQGAPGPEPSSVPDPPAAEPAAGGRPKRVSAGEATRRRVVAAAAELTLEHYADTGPSDPRRSLAYLTPGAVAARAGTSRPLLYHHWGDGTDAFGAFLGDVVAEVWRRSSVTDELLELAEAVGPDPADHVRVLANAEGTRLLGPRGPLVRAAQSLLLEGLVEDAAVRGVTDGLAEMYRELANASGFAPAGDLTFVEIATAVELVCEGYWLQGNVHPERLERRYSWRSRLGAMSGGAAEPTDDWTLFAIAADAILAAFLRPADDPGPLSAPPPDEPPSPRG